MPDVVGIVVTMGEPVLAGKVVMTEDVIPGSRTLPLLRLGIAKFV